MGVAATQGKENGVWGEAYGAMFFFIVTLKGNPYSGVGTIWRKESKQNKDLT